MKKYINLLLILEAIICILMCVFGGGKVTFVNTLLTFPFKPIAVGLRKLSFLGGVGNIFSWLLFLLICSIPLIILIAKLIRKRFVLEDILLVVISLIVALALYHMININLMASQMIVPIVENDALYCVLGAIVYSIIAGYLVIKVIRKFAKANKEEVKRYFNNVLFVANVFIVLGSFGISLNELIIKLDNYVNSNFGIYESLMTTKVFLIMDYAMDVIINLLLIGIIILVQDLISKINIDNITDEVVKRAKLIFSCCIGTIIIHTILSIMYNALQFIFIKKLYFVNGVVSIPIMIIFIVLVIMLFTQFILEAKKIKEENDMFI